MHYQNHPYCTGTLRRTLETSGLIRKASVETTQLDFTLCHVKFSAMCPAKAVPVFLSPLPELCWDLIMLVFFFVVEAPGILICLKPKPKELKNKIENNLIG